MPDFRFQAENLQLELRFEPSRLGLITIYTCRQKAVPLEFRSSEKEIDTLILLIGNPGFENLTTVPYNSYGF